jgi:hypothetical protein
MRIPEKFAEKIKAIKAAHAIIIYFKGTTLSRLLK